MYIKIRAEANYTSEHILRGDAPSRTKTKKLPQKKIAFGRRLSFLLIPDKLPHGILK